MLEVANVSVNFEAVPALADVTLRVEAGEVVALSGEPGAGKTALLRCIAGDLSPSSGEIRVAGEPLASGLRETERQGVTIVWQDLALVDTLDVAGNLLLGQETSLQLAFGGGRFHTRAEQALNDLGLHGFDPTQLAGSLTGGKRRLLALAMALIRKPRVLLLDEPTVSLGLAETTEFERLLARTRAQGTAILMSGGDIGQIFRIADRIAVLRHGRVVAELAPQDSHPDDVVALAAGNTAASSARRQLIRLHGLADSLALSDPSSGLTLIVSALAAALGVDRNRIDVIRAPLALPSSDRVIVEGRNWLVPLFGPSGTNAVITVARDSAEPPTRDDLDLLGLYAGYAAAAIERQGAEAAQLEAAALRRSRELQRQFLSRLSHELRTPLTAIHGYASSLLAPDIVWDDDSHERFLERIAAESARLGRLVGDLLDFSAMESGVMRMQLDWCELELVIGAAVAILPGDWPSMVTIDVDPTMPVIWGDHDRLEQVFVNLLTNALHHNPPETHVHVTARMLPDGTATIVVRDDGPGLPKALSGSPFDSTDRPRAPTSGAGLGLSITKGIVEAHGGTISVDSSRAGTAFTLLLPVDAPDHSAEPGPMRGHANV